MTTFHPPPRYSEASWLRKWKSWYRRPSTYASIISVLSTRNCTELLNKRFHPTDRGKLLSAFLEKLFLNMLTIILQQI